MKRSLTLFTSLAIGFPAFATTDARDLYDIKKLPPEENMSTVSPDRQFPKLTGTTDKDGRAGGSSVPKKDLTVKYDQDVQLWNRRIERVKTTARQNKDTEIRQRQQDTAEFMEKKFADLRNNVEKLKSTADPIQWELLNRTIEEDTQDLNRLFGATGLAE